MSNTVSFFDAIGDGTLVGSDSFLDMVVVWNASSTFNVFYHWGKDRWEEVDCFTQYDIWLVKDAMDAALKYFARVHEEAAQEAEYNERWQYAEA